MMQSIGQTLMQVEKLLMVADAFGAAIRVYLVNLAPQADGLVRTLRIAHVTVDALVGDEQCHLQAAE